MSKIGHISEFNSDGGDWDIYVERVKLFIKVNGVKDELKVPTLLTVMGEKAYKKIRTLCSPEKPEDKLFDELIKIMSEKGNNPKPTEIAARFAFNARKQTLNESIGDYHLILKELSDDCVFGDNLETRLRDQLVFGLINKTIQEELLREKKLTYKLSLEIALSRECALKEATTLNAQVQPTSVHKVQYHRDTAQSVKCKHCGRKNHKAQDCRFKDATCHQCQKKGHIKTICRSGSAQHAKPQKKVSKPTYMLEVNSDSDDALLLNAMSIHNHKVQPMYADVVIDGKSISMEIDTGAAVSVINEADFNRLSCKRELEETDIILSTYTNEQIKPIGVCTVCVESNEKSFSDMKLYVLNCTDAPPLLGRSWLREMQLDWKSIRKLNETRPTKNNASFVDDLKRKYPTLFSDSMGKMKDIKARIDVKPDATPRFLKARPVPIALRDKVNENIEKLVNYEVLSPIRHSDWATPIVPVIKSDGSVRICGDFKVTVNPVLNVEKYPQPRREDLFASLAGGKTFSKVDLASAYLQMEVEEDSKQYLTINTPKGLFRYNRLVFGIASAPAIFQRAIETILQRIPGVIVYQDDILVTGNTDKEHLQSLTTVLERLEHYGLRVKLSKCSFFAQSITYLGHKIDKDGVSTVQNKVQAVKDAPTPTNVSELRSFLGVVNFYGSFIPSLSTKLAALHNLLRNDVEWKWTDECESAFRNVKECLCSSPVLAHYDPKLPLVVACDASPYGIASILSHRYPDKSERPIAFASRALTESEKNYAQIDREALAVIYGVKKFNEYIFGRQFILITDNRPLCHILAPEKPIPNVAAARIQRWAVYLGAHNYIIEHRPATEHANVDGLSRLPLPTTNHKKVKENMFTVSQIELLPLTSTDIAQQTCKDPILSKVYHYTLNGWETYDYKSLKDSDLQTFYNRRNDISLFNGVLMCGIRVVVPTVFRERVLAEIHEGHLGVVKMKSIARSHVYWPNIDKEIEQRAYGCSGCALVRKLPPASLLHPWEWPSQPWRRLHIDYAGPFLNRMFLVVVDAHSKWPEVISMRTATSATTIRALRDIFARFGIPDQLVSDNGAQFTSAEFCMFLKQNGIRHIKSAPYHPSTNGLAERFVQTFKLAMKSAKATESTVDMKLPQFLMAYRNVSHSTTAASPANLLIGRPLKTRLDLLNPSCEIASRVSDKQARQIADSNRSRQVQFKTGDAVLVRDYRPGADKWINAEVESPTGPVSYQVRLPDQSQPWRRHADQMLPATPTITSQPQIPTPDVAPPVFEHKEVAHPDTVVHSPNVPPDIRVSDRSRQKPNRLIEEC